MAERFLSPSSVGEAVRLCHETRGRFLAGGTELNRFGPPPRGTLVSLACVPIRAIRAEAGAVRIGAMTTLQEIADSPEIAGAGLAVLCEAARSIGNRNIRNVATIGGNLAANHSYSDMIPPLLVLDASVTLASASGEREIPLAQWVSEPAPTALITEVRVAPPSADLRVAWRCFRRTANDYGLVSAALAVRVEGQRIAEARLALGGVAETVVRVAEAEAALAEAGAELGVEERLRRLGEVVGAHVSPPSDLRGDAAFRRKLAVELARRVLLCCLESA